MVTCATPVQEKDFPKRGKIPAYSGACDIICLLFLLVRNTMRGRVTKIMHAAEQPLDTVKLSTLIIKYTVIMMDLSLFISVQYKNAKK